MIINRSLVIDSHRRVTDGAIWRQASAGFSNLRGITKLEDHNKKFGMVENITT